MCSSPASIGRHLRFEHLLQRRPHQRPQKLLVLPQKGFDVDRPRFTLPLGDERRAGLWEPDVRFLWAEWYPDLMDGTVGLFGSFRRVPWSASGPRSRMRSLWISCEKSHHATQFASSGSVPGPAQHASNCSFEHCLLVLPEPFLRSFRKDVPERPFLIGNELDHLCDHIVRIQPSFRLRQEAVRDLFHHGARCERHRVVEPPIAASTMVSLNPVRYGPGLIV